MTGPFLASLRYCVQSPVLQNNNNNNDTKAWNELQLYAKICIRLWSYRNKIDGEPFVLWNASSKWRLRQVQSYINSRGLCCVTKVNSGCSNGQFLSFISVIFTIYSKFFHLVILGEIVSYGKSGWEFPVFPFFYIHSLLHRWQASAPKFNNSVSFSWLLPLAWLSFDSVLGLRFFNSLFSYQN